jgi:TonB family protein
MKNAVLGLFIAVAGATGSAYSFGGVALDVPVHDAINQFGTPAVATTDVGTVWTWDRSFMPVHSILRVTTDDDGVVKMIDLAIPSGTLGVRGIPTMPAPLTFGDDAAVKVDAAIGAPEFVGKGLFPDGGDATFRGYRVSGNKELVLLYAVDPPVLREAFYGERATLMRGGLIPGTTPSDVYRAPVMRGLGSADYQSNRQGTVYTRIVVNADGSVRAASVFISSGSSELDNIALQVAKHSTFAPGTRDGVPTQSVFYRREDFVVAPH